MTSRNCLKLQLPLAFVCALFAGSAAAADAMAAGPIKQANAAPKKASFQPPAAAKGDVSAALSGSGDIVFSTPPRETLDAAMEIYQPVVDYLSQVLGKKVVFKHPGTWGVYRTEMVKGNYDIVFDGPHFNSYRMDKMQHNIIVKIPGDFVFVTIVKKGNDAIGNSRQLAGRTVCAHAPPNLGTLTLLSQFDNPSRQPVIISTDGWKNIYQGVVSGRCVAGVLPIKNLKKFDTEGMAKIIHKEKTLPNQAFSAGPRLSAEDQAKVTRALTSPEANGPTEKLRKAYNTEKFVQASNQEYAGLAEYLKNEWGYY